MDGWSFLQLGGVLVAVPIEFCRVCLIEIFVKEYYYYPSFGFPTIESHFPVSIE